MPDHQEHIDRIAHLLDDAGRAHHKAFFDTDGADPDWPLWYADYLLDNLRLALRAQFTRSELVYLLVMLDREQRMHAPGATWTPAGSWTRWSAPGCSRRSRTRCSTWR